MSQGSSESGPVNAGGFVRFGPKASIKRLVWDDLRKEALAYAKSKKEFCVALRGNFKDGWFQITAYTVLTGPAGESFVNYSIDDVVNIDQVFRQQGEGVGGLLHTHLHGSVVPSHQDMESWTATLLQMDHPIHFYILEPSTSKISGRAMPFDLWVQLKNALKPVEFAVD